MTAIEKVLLRKDAASLVVAVTLAMTVGFFLSTLTNPLTFYVTLTNHGQAGPPVGDMLLQSVISFVAQLVVLELLVRLVILTRGRLYKKGK